VDQLMELPYGRCLALLSSQSVGRIAITAPDGPHIVPVNYAVVEESIVFRTTPYSLLGTHAWNARLAFEVDQLDPERQRGWSVVARGRGTIVEDDLELAEIKRTWDPRPWAGGARFLYVRLRWDELTGRHAGPGGFTRTDEPLAGRAV